MDAPFEPSKQTLFYVGWRSFHHRGYLVAYLREADLVGVSEYKTCSCNDTDQLFAEETWASTNWEFLGPSDKLKELCAAHRDFKLPDRPVLEDDYNAKWILKLHEVFVEWMDAGKPRWEDERPKREYSAFRGGKLDAHTKNCGPGDVDMSTFERDMALRDGLSRQKPFSDRLAKRAARSPSKS